MKRTLNLQLHSLKEIASKETEFVCSQYKQQCHSLDEDLNLIKTQYVNFQKITDGKIGQLITDLEKWKSKYKELNSRRILEMEGYG